jgi:acetolactate synthase-1/2/3 large subunit
MTGGRLLVECLIKQEVNVIFGIPGNQLAPVYEGLYHLQYKIRHVLTRHESGAAFMADGYARSSGKIGVCMTIPGPGAGNAHIAMGEASTDCVPVLLITSQNESRYEGKDRTKMFHGLDQVQAFKPVTKIIESVAHAKDIPAAFERIFSALRNGRPRPALLEISSDALADEINSNIPNFVNTSEKIHNLEPIQALITDSQKIAIIAGSGIHHSKAHDELRQLAEELKAPVFTTIMGKGAIPEDHSLSLGGSRSGQARQAIESCDLLLAIGTRFTQMDTGGWSMKMPEKWIHIEADSNEIGKEYKPTIGISGSPKDILKQLLDMPLARSSDEWQQRVITWQDEIRDAKPPEIIMLMRKVIPRDAIMSVDVHMTGYGMHRHFPTYLPGTFLYPGIYIALGYGLPAAIGAKIANPERKVVSLSGDSGFLMTGMELSTIAQNELPIVMIVCNDNALTSIRWSQENRFGKTLGVDVKNPDYLKYADSFGIKAVRIEQRADFCPSLIKALDDDRPILIELTPEVFR